MKLEEAIEIIHEKHIDIEFYFAEHDRYPKYYDFEFDQAILMAAQALEEIQKYREIGTVEECLEAVEKQKAKYIKIESYCPAYCPTCRFELSESLGDGYYEYFVNLSRCPKCGQKICWDEDLEGMEDA